MKPASDKVARATEFARRAHAQQQHKYSGEPYVNHLIEVASIVATVDDSDDALCAALLHDTLEDTAVTAEELQQAFGPAVRALVENLTDHHLPVEGGPNRALRKAMEAQRLARTPPQAQTIKVADIISNTRSLTEAAPGFARVYLREATLMLSMLTLADPRLRRQAQAIVAEGRRQLWRKQPAGGAIEARPEKTGRGQMRNPPPAQTSLE